MRWSGCCAVGEVVPQRAVAAPHRRRLPTTTGEVPSVAGGEVPDGPRHALAEERASAVDTVPEREGDNGKECVS